MISNLKKIGLPLKVIPNGAFHVFVNISQFTNDVYKFALDLLDSTGVAVTPGIDFGAGGEGFVRLCYANSIENLKEGLMRLGNYIKKYNR